MGTIMDQDSTREKLRLRPDTLATLPSSVRRRPRPSARRSQPLRRSPRTLSCVDLNQMRFVKTRKSRFPELSVKIPRRRPRMLKPSKQRNLSIAFHRNSNKHRKIKKKKKKKKSTL